jgi:drug/metabolite transporter (DMT)-like permease
MARMSNERSGWGGAAIVLIAASLFGSLGVLSRTAYDEGLTPFAFVTWRAAVGAAGLWLAIGLARSRGRGIVRWRSITPAARRSLGFAILVGTGLNLAIFTAFDHTSIALALLGFYTYPAIVAGASVLLGREQLDRARVVALGLALAGMVAVVLGGSDPAATLRLDALGIGAALLAAFCQAAFVLLSRGYAALPTEQAMGGILVGTAVLAAAVTVITGGPGALTLPFGQPSLLGLLLIVGIFAAAVPSSLFLAGIRQLGAVRTGILMLAEPVVGVVLAAIFLAEAVAPLQVAGGLTILVAAVVVQRDTRRGDVPAPLAPAPGGL